MSGTYAQLPRLKISTAGFLERFHPTHRRGDSTEEMSVRLPASLRPWLAPSDGEGIPWPPLVSIELTAFLSSFECSLMNGELCLRLHRPTRPPRQAELPLRG